MSDQNQSIDKIAADHQWSISYSCNSTGMTLRHINDVHGTTIISVEPDETWIDGLVSKHNNDIKSAIEKATETLRAVIRDDCETDTNVRNLARPILGDFAVDGDSYGVPGLEDIVEQLIASRPAAASSAKDAARQKGEG